MKFKESFIMHSNSIYIAFRKIFIIQIHIVLFYFVCILVYGSCFKNMDKCGSSVVLIYLSKARKNMSLSTNLSTSDNEYYLRQWKNLEQVLPNGIWIKTMTTMFI